MKFQNIKNVPQVCKQMANVELDKRVHGVTAISWKGSWINGNIFQEPKNDYDLPQIICTIFTLYFFVYDKIYI